MTGPRDKGLVFPKMSRSVWVPRLKVECREAAADRADSERSPLMADKVRIVSCERASARTARTSVADRRSDFSNDFWPPFGRRGDKEKGRQGEGRKEKEKGDKEKGRQGETAEQRDRADKETFDRAGGGQASAVSSTLPSALRLRLGRETQTRRELGLDRSRRVSRTETRAQPVVFSSSPDYRTRGRSNRPIGFFGVSIRLPRSRHCQRRTRPPWAVGHGDDGDSIASF